MTTNNVHAIESHREPFNVLRKAPRTGQTFRIMPDGTVQRVFSHERVSK